MFYKFSKGKPLLSVPNGIGDGSAYFDGNSYCLVNIPSNMPVGDEARTFACWLYLRAFSDNWSKVIDTGNRSYAESFALGIYKERIAFSGYGEEYDYYSDYYLSLKTWYHLVLTYENNLLIAYVNGIKVWEQPTNTLTTNNVGLGIGCNALDDSNEERANANIKDVLIYNRALTAEEVTTLYNKQEITDGRVLNIPLQYEKDDESLFTSKSFVYDYSIIKTSSGFNSLGKPIRYRSASGAGIEYSPIDIPKDGLVFYADYKNGKDRVTKTVGECNNVDFIKYKGCNCAYFNGVDSSILWKNILTSDLQYYTIFTKFAVLPKEHWGMVFGLSPKNNRGQGYSIKTYRNIQHYCNHGNDYGGADLSYDTWGVSALVGYGEWIELYHNGTVYVGHSATSIPANSWLYNGIDFGYNADPQQYYGYIAESIVYNRTFTKEELQALTQQLLNKGA